MITRAAGLPRRTVAVAYSGGRDSTALLHATASAARRLGLDVVALHVHHGLMPQADAWLAAAERQCARWRRGGLPVRLMHTRLTGGPPRGESVEAWARHERRAALARMARQEGVQLVLLAHHRRDQAETVLLQALRGSGASGLAAMPRQVERDGIVWSRPWIDQPKASIEAYLRRHRLHGVDDPSNADPRFARSRLRHAVWPALVAAFPDVEQALCVVAGQAAQAAQLQAAVAAIDLATLRDGARLRLPVWRQLDEARRVNALRVWLRERLGHAAPRSLLERLASELPHAQSARWPVTADHQLALHRGRLALAPVADAPARAPAEQVIDLSRPGMHPVPAWAGAFVVRRVARDGLAPSALRQVQLRGRVGGERFQAHAAGVPRSLKKQYQAAGLAAWERHGPLVWHGDRLLFVSGLGADARMLTRGAGLALVWQPIGDGMLRRKS